MNKHITVTNLVKAITGKYKILGDASRNVTVPMSIENSTEKSFSFCSKTGIKAMEMIRASKAGVIICSDQLRCVKSDYRDHTLIQVTNPRLTFIQILRYYFTDEKKYVIHPTAIIDHGAIIAKRVFIGPHSVIGSCRIGEGTIIYGNVTLYSNISVGKNVTIHAGAVIGKDGYGYERNEKGTFEHFPHMGGVIIGDNVEIGSNVSIDRGSLGDTVIGEGTKIDNLCHIAHNVTIGKHCMIIALSMIGGSTKIGDYSYIAPSATIINKIEVGKNALVGLGAVVTENVEDNTVVTGLPAKPLRKNKPNKFLSV